MYELIVLGLVPGTHIQINFDEWLTIASLFCALVAMWQAHRAHLARTLIISLYMAVRVRQVATVEIAPYRR